MRIKDGYVFDDEKLKRKYIKKKRDTNRRNRRKEKEKVYWNV